MGEGCEQGFLDYSKGTVFVCMVGAFGGLAGRRIGHFCVRSIGIGRGAIFRGEFGRCIWDWVKEFCALGVAGYYGDFVGMVKSKMGVDKHEQVGNCFGEWEGFG